MTVRFLTQPAPEALREIVREFWVLEDAGAMHAGLPKPYVELVVSLDGLHFWRNRSEGEEHAYDHSWITPLQDGPRHARSDGPRRLTGARLEPRSAAALFGPLPPGDGRPPPHLGELIGPEADRLRDALLATRSDPALFAVFADWLATRSAAASPSPRLALSEGERAEAVAARLGVSPRSLRRVYAREVGTSPKQILLLHRLDAVLRDPQMLDTAVPLADLAAKHGFADQAHMTRQISRLTGATPRSLRRRRADGPPHML